jgi:choline dehydrogenase-like flavoprotein
MNGPEGSPVTDYDYVIAGGGTAGCVLAARLSEDPGTRVLLLEAGSAEMVPAMMVPDAWPGLVGSAADWGGTTVAQADAGPLPYPRGRGLGGSGAINAMAHVRGHRAVYGRPGARPGGDTRTCCRTSSGPRTRRVVTRRCAGPAARSGSRRSRKPAGIPLPSPWLRRCARSAAR